MTGKQKKILYFTCQPLYTPGSPATGGGLRAYGIGQALNDLGHEVIFSEPAYLAGGAQDCSGNSESDYCHNVENIPNIISKVKPDVVILGNWGIADRAADIDVPTVVDINGSLILENYYREHAALFEDMLAKIRALGKMDLILAGSDKQKMYLLGWCLMAGIKPESIRIEVLPFSLPPSLPIPEPPNEPVLVMAGYQWPWLDGQEAVETVSSELDKLQTGVLKIYTSGPQYFDVFSGENSIGKEQGFMDVSSMPRVELCEPVSFDDLTEVLSNSTVALDVWEDNLERELAVPTRAVVYLWSGLPIISNKGGGLGEWIEMYGAGWTVDPSDKEALAGLVRDIIGNPGLLERPRAGAQHLVREHFVWDRTIGVLGQFCESTWRNRNISPIVERLDDLEATVSGLEIDKTELEKYIDEFHRQMGQLSLPGLLWNRTRRFVLGIPVLAYLLLIAGVGEFLSGLRSWLRLK